MKKKEMKRTTIYIEKDIYTNLRYVSATKDIKLNDCIKVALLEYLKRNEKFLPKL